MLKQLDHPNIVKYVSSFRDKKKQGEGRDTGFFYIVMEKLTGGLISLGLMASSVNLGSVWRTGGCGATDWCSFFRKCTVLYSRTCKSVQLSSC